MYFKKLLGKPSIINNLIVTIILSFFLPTLIITPILLGITVLLVWMKVKPRVYNYKEFPPHLLLFTIYFLFVLVSLTYSYNMKNGVKELINHISFIIVPLIFIHIRKEELNFNYLSKKYIDILLLVFLLLVLFAIYRNVNDGYTISYVIKRILGMEASSRNYAYFNYWYFVYDKFCDPLKIQPIYLGLFTNIGLAFLYLNPNFLRSKSFLLKLIALFTFLTLLGSRWQLAIGILNLIIYIFYWSKGIGNKIRIFSIITIITVVGAISLLNPIIKIRIIEALSYKEAFYDDSFGGTSIRIRKWYNAANAIQESPFLGYGIGDFKEVLLNQYIKDKFYLGYYEKFNSHNQYLDTSLAIGIFGLTMLLIILFIGFYYSRNNILLFFISNIYFLSFFTESMFSRQWGIISFPFFISLAFLYKAHTTKLDSKK